MSFNVQQFLQSRRQPPEEEREEEAAPFDVQAFLQQRRERPQVPVAEERIPERAPEERPRKTKTEVAAEIGLPVAFGAGGALLGSVIPIVGTTAGGILGAMVGRGVEEVGEQLIKKEPSKFLPKTFKELAFEDTALGNILKEGVGAAVGGKVLSLIKPGFKAASAALKGATALGAKQLNTIVSTMDNLIKKIPTGNQDKFWRKFSEGLERQAFPAQAARMTEALRDFGVKDVLRPKWVNRLSGALSSETIEKVSSTFDEAIKPLSEKFDKLVKPTFKIPVQRERAVALADDFLKRIEPDVDEAFKITKKAGRQRLTGRQRFTAKASIDDKIAADFGLLVDDLEKIAENPTVGQLHRFKQTLNNTINKKAFEDVPQGKKLLFGLKGDVVDLIESQSSRYKEVSKEFFDLFELEKQVGTRLSKTRVEGLMNDLLRKDKQFLIDAVESLGGKNKKVKRIFDEALKERVALNFSSGLRGTGIGVPVTKTGLRVGLPGPTRRTMAGRILRRESTGGLRPGLARRAAAGTALGAAGREAITGLGRTTGDIVRGLGRAPQEERGGL